MYENFEIPPKKTTEPLTCSYHLFVTGGSNQNLHVRRAHVGTWCISVRLATSFQVCLNRKMQHLPIHLCLKCNLNPFTISLKFKIILKSPQLLHVSALLGHLKGIYAQLMRTYVRRGHKLGRRKRKLTWKGEREFYSHTNIF
jgi:hypothetical protein